MIIFRRKNFANIPNPGAYNGDTVSKQNSMAYQQQQAQAGQSNDDSPASSKDLLIQQMRLQRQIMITQQQRQRMQNQETMEQMKQLSQKSKAQSDKDNAEKSQNIRVQRQQQEDQKPDNTGLYKTKSKILPPVSMKV